jgi:hypothetical protein
LLQPHCENQSKIKITTPRKNVIMKIKQFLFFLITSLCFTNLANAQSTVGKFWSPINEETVRVSGKRQILPQKYSVFQLNGAVLKNQLFAAPIEKKVNLDASTCVISLPLPTGEMQNFKLVESPIMAEALSTAFPEIKTFSLKGIDDPYATGKIDWNEFGFHGMVRSINGDFFIDPYCVGNISDYIAYYTSDFIKNPADIIPEIGVVDNNNTKKQPDANKDKVGLKTAAVGANCVGDQLRTYRLAVTCTGEYAVAATGFASPTIAQTLARIVTTVNRVNGVYEKEVAIRLVLVATETVIIFTNAGTDPFTANNNGPNLLNESQTVITNAIGSANFDIGHIFSTGGGGIANLGCVCDDSNKARGVTGSANPVGDPYDIDYVAHEMGHQFNANHPFNAITGGCNGNRNAATAVEPGSGVTIMGYAGLCNSVNDLAPNSIPYFHAISYDEIINFTHSGGGSSCPVITSTGNQPPIVNGSGSYVIPKSTPFILTGSATDPDGDALTYSWEETDIGPGSGGNWNSGNKPYFRSYAPTAVPSRSFPINSVALSGNYTGTKGEYLPATAQQLTFRLTARDNKMGGGGVCYSVTDTVTIDSSGPLTVTYPSAASITWASASQQTVTWDVNSTDLAPVSCASVRIYISYNSGNTYSLLIPSTLNDGIQQITAPTVTTDITTCRIKVESLGNIFYDVGNNNFSITAPVGIKSISQNNLLGMHVWPNPFTGRFNFAVSNLNTESATVLTVMDVLGKVILQTSYSNKVELKESIDLTSASKGIYFLKITNDNKQAVYKIVKD